MRLKVVQTSEDILKSLSLWKVGYDYYFDDQNETNKESLPLEANKFLAILEEKEKPTSISRESEVAHLIVGNIVKRTNLSSFQLKKKTVKESLLTLVTMNNSLNSYLLDISRCRLAHSSMEICCYI